MYVANVEARLRTPVNAVRGMGDCRRMSVLSHRHNAGGTCVAPPHGVIMAL
jgi:hypothetical protein